MKRTINNDIYKMYEEEYLRNIKLENANLKYELEYKTNSFEKKIKSEIEKKVTPLIKENDTLKEKLNDAYE